MGFLEDVWDWMVDFGFGILIILFGILLVAGLVYKSKDLEPGHMFSGALIIAIVFVFGLMSFDYSWSNDLQGLFGLSEHWPLGA
jgi:hypothetical protein